MRQQVQKVIFDLCPRGEMNRCLCEDNSKITFPFNALELISCYPKKVMYHDLTRWRKKGYVAKNIYQGLTNPKVLYSRVILKRGQGPRLTGTFYWVAALIFNT